MKIEKLKIENFRGIKSFEEYFGNTNLVCLVGRGDSTKSTILEAINLCLTSRWSVALTDYDFHNASTEEDIDIHITFSDIPEKLLNETKYGMYVRLFDREARQFVGEESESAISTLTINLNINSRLDPEWRIISDNLDPKNISFRDRNLLGVFLISDYSDYHLSWSQGSPLYALQSLISEDQVSMKEPALEAIRKIRKNISTQSFEDFNQIIRELEGNVQNMGEDISNVKASIDIKDMAFRANIVSLHREQHQIPMRMDGKGTKRLVSISIQQLLVQKGGLMLIDEIEQGLEPDRIKNLARNLETVSCGQTFLATHSRSVIEELEAKNIFIVQNTGGAVTCANSEAERFQKLYRACPEAAYATKVIICEGKTELGLMRALDKWRVLKGERSFSSLGVVYSYGEGDTVFERAQSLNALGIKVLLICDSDKTETKKKKIDCGSEGIVVVDCEKGLDIEQQIFKDISWEGIYKILQIGVDLKGERDINDQIKQSLSDFQDSQWGDLDNEAGRRLLADISKSWSKNIRGGGRLGDVIFQEYNDMKEELHLKSSLSTINCWIETDAE